MYPTICKIGPLTIPSFGVMLALAFIVCAIFLSRDAKGQGIDPEIIFDFIFWIAIAGILGARLFYIFLNYSYFLQYPFQILLVNRGGLAWQGGLLGGCLSAVVFFKRRKLPMAKMLDLVAPYAALGQAIGRIGCFLNGCCHGHPSSWGIYFPVHDATLYPTQLYSSGGLLVAFFVLKFYQKRSSLAGSVFVFYLMLASVLRFVIEFFRAEYYVNIFGLSIFQVVCLIVFFISLYVYSRLKSRSVQ